MNRAFSDIILKLLLADVLASTCYFQLVKEDARIHIERAPMPLGCARTPILTLPSIGAFAFGACSFYYVQPPHVTSEEKNRILLLSGGS